MGHLTCKCPGLLLQQSPKCTGKHSRSLMICSRNTVTAAVPTVAVRTMMMMRVMAMSKQPFFRHRRQRCTQSTFVYWKSLNTGRAKSKSSDARTRHVSYSDHIARRRSGANFAHDAPRCILHHPLVSTWHRTQAHGAGSRHLHAPRERYLSLQPPRHPAAPVLQACRPHRWLQHAHRRPCQHLRHYYSLLPNHVHVTATSLWRHDYTSACCGPMMQLAAPDAR